MSIKSCFKTNKIIKISQVNNPVPLKPKISKVMLILCVINSEVSGCVVLSLWLQSPRKLLALGSLSVLRNYIWRIQNMYEKRKMYGLVTIPLSVNDIIISRKYTVLTCTVIILMYLTKHCVNCKKYTFYENGELCCLVWKTVVCFATSVFYPYGWYEGYTYFFNMLVGRLLGTGYVLFSDFCFSNQGLIVYMYLCQ